MKVIIFCERKPGRHDATFSYMKEFFEDVEVFRYLESIFPMTAFLEKKSNNIIRKSTEDHMDPAC